MGNRRVKAAKSMAKVSGGFSIFGFSFGGSKDKPKIDKSSISAPTNAHGVGGMGNVNPDHVMQYGTKLDGHWAFSDMPKVGK